MDAVHRPGVRFYEHKTKTKTICVRNTRYVCFAKKSPVRKDVGDDVPLENVNWDPEGLLPSMPKQSHFERRGETISSAPDSVNAGKNISASYSAQEAQINPLLRPVESTRKSVSDRSVSQGGSAADVVPGNHRTPFAEVPVAPEEGLGATIEEAFRKVFVGAHAAPRVLKSFQSLRGGFEHESYIPGKGVLRASSFVEGLTAEPFPDVNSPDYAWLKAIEDRSSEIQSEFFDVMSQGEETIKSKGTNVWVPAARDDAVSYGPNWRTLVLQDRGAWEETNSSLFPKTRKIIEEVDAPTLEVFFARQQKGTGIASHTDNANFIQTSHIGIDVPEGKCWIKVGEFTREWENGKAIAMHTAFMHETMNEGDKDRYVLILRHWHPEMTGLERIATMFLFSCLDDPSPENIKSSQKVALKELKSLASSGMAASGFGVGAATKQPKSKKGGKKKRS